ncbi:hypothetical protein RB215_03330 [Pseudoalteromonas sp. HL-AS2]|uniref:hypothetical protein n=1 Tax=Pseudoalteromonas sp. HL-AS2 TaxID=3071082 RepID=UPI00281619FE|nr:hypothetical protein [Pseudoalteromonas sp. HL-AS2]WMS95107.1 hypothetical protein RB215_03330 [Pseudoalteromonas sp. HL-AS2]
MRFKKVLYLLFLSTLAGCSSTSDQPLTLSAGGQLLLETKIQSNNEIKKLLEKSTKDLPNNEYSKELVAQLDTTTNVVFGSGLVSSAAVLAESGAWVSPGNFTNWGQLGFSAMSFLVSKDMKRHPLTYTYFFNKDPKCDDLKCTEKALSSFFKDMSDEYIKSSFNKGHNGAPIEKVEIKTSNFILDRVTLFYNYDEPEGKRDLDWTVMSVPKLDEINEEQFIWGNKDPRSMPDTIGFLDLPYIEASNMLINVSKRHPTILIYRGISHYFAKEGKPCYGGFFIKNGKPIVVDELNCVKFVG